MQQAQGEGSAEQSSQTWAAHGQAAGVYLSCLRKGGSPLGSGCQLPTPRFCLLLSIIVNLQQGSESSGFRHISGIFCCYSHDKCVPIWASSHCLPQLPRAAPERLRQRLLPQNLRPKHLLRTLGLQTSQNKTKKNAKW